MEHGLQKKIAAAAGVSRSYLSAILGGTKVPSVKAARDLEEKTGVPKELWAFGPPEKIKQALEERFAGNVAY